MPIFSRSSFFRKSIGKKLFINKSFFVLQQLDEENITLSDALSDQLYIFVDRGSFRVDWLHGRYFLLIILKKICPRVKPRFHFRPIDTNEEPIESIGTFAIIF